ncbi:hypothetical protein JOC85_002986 [Bacillus mesophilus]|uniref:Uncharacterized protein n=1 Tax=Bacillus mesophilus TaxID=1808955 RepID=A0A6M0QAB7_9BACI|nr:hypothetical protein [Bacillus mesophilus]MBM7662179.1 hypothetical protein [Bacillus mesophilus]NEY72470.1 hypothetical protein [Bacillus mesophilus]
MFNVHFFENKNLLLNQARNNVPAVGDVLTIKGRKGTVTSITKVDEVKIHIEMELDQLIKNKQLADDSKKKKR